MESVKVYFGTAKPIRYQELDERIGLDIDVDCRINGYVNVEEYPEEYPDEEALKAAVKEITVAALTDFLHNLQKKNFGRLFYSYRSRDELLKNAVDEALSEKGIRGETEIGAFTLDSDSADAIQLFKEELGKPLMYVDEMCKDNDLQKQMVSPANDQAKSMFEMAKLYEQQTKATYAGPAQMAPQMMMVYAGPAQMNNGAGMMFGMMQVQQQMEKEKEKAEAKKQIGVYCICPVCGYQTQPYSFCPECGNPLKDAKRYRDCPACGTRVSEKSRFCHECGKALNEGESN